MIQTSKNSKGLSRSSLDCSRWTSLLRWHPAERQVLYQRLRRCRGCRGCRR